MTSLKPISLSVYLFIPTFNNKIYSMWEIAEKLKMIKSSVSYNLIRFRDTRNLEDWVYQVTLRTIYNSNDPYIKLINKHNQRLIG